MRPSPRSEQSSHLLERAGRLWAARARFELEAQVRFSALSNELAAIGAPTQIVELAAKASEDEARHHQLARALAEQLGASRVSSKLPTQVTSPAPTTLTPRRKALYNSVALCAVMESLSVLLLREMRMLAEHPDVRATLHSILTDEVHHSRVGWGHLAFEAQRGDVRFLSRFVPGMLAGTVQDELFDTPEGDRGAELEPWGGLGRKRRRRCFEEATRELILPGLKTFGVDPSPGLAWLDARGG